MNNIRYKSTLRDKNRSAREKDCCKATKGARRRGGQENERNLFYSLELTVVTRILQFVYNHG